MISNISAASTAAVSSAQTPPQAPAPAVAQKKEDSVHLSPQAQAAAKGDVDHDGDSH
jgi:hypothetical protein